MWNIGYTKFDAGRAGARQDWLDQAVDIDGPFVTHFATLARELGMAIAITYLSRGPTLPYNTLSLFDRHGNLSFTYSKVHTCCYEIPEAVCTPGNGFFVRPLDTKAGTVNVGAMICYDREFPESARILMLQGAELILTPNACTLAEYDNIRIHQFRSRAFENMVAAAMTNYAGPVHDGRSIACGPDGSVIVLADDSEAVIMAEFDLAKIRQWRADKWWGDAFRRPALYGSLVDAPNAEPFVRKDLFGVPLDTRRAG
jgi:predicted amidohydrolase